MSVVVYGKYVREMRPAIFFDRGKDRLTVRTQEFVGFSAIHGNLP